MTVTGFWFAIEDATLQNGCLWAKPGGHRTALRKVFKRAGDTDDDGTLFEELDTTPLPSPSELVPLEVPAGTMVILHGLLPHWSDINRSRGQPPRLLAALHLRRGRLPGVELAAAACRHAVALARRTVAA